MPYANNQGVHIHYQVMGDGPPLVLQHGFSASLMDWYDFGYVEELCNDYRLILVDARGHGESEKLYEPEQYDLEQFVSDLTTVLDDLHIKKTNYLGYSMGGSIGFGMAKYARHRLNALIIGGAQPYGINFEPLRELLRTGLETWVAIVETWDIHSPDGLARMRNNDARALLAVIQDRPDISDVLPGMTMPCLLYAGSEDDQYELIARCAEELSNVTLVSLPGLNHFNIIPRSDLVVPYVKEFLAKP